MDADEAAEAATQDDWMTRTASLARCSPAAAFGFVADLLGQAQQRLYSCAVQGEAVQFCGASLGSTAVRCIAR